MLSMLNVMGWITCGAFWENSILTFDCLNKVGVMLQCQKHENMNEEAGESVTWKDSIKSSRFSLRLSGGINRLLLRALKWRLWCLHKLLPIYYAQQTIYILHMYMWATFLCLLKLVQLSSFSSSAFNPNILDGDPRAQVEMLHRWAM